MIKRDVGVWLGVAGGVLCIVTSSVYIPMFAGLLFEYVGLLLAIGISLSAIIGAVLVRKCHAVIGGYLMFLTAFIWILSYPLLFVLPTGQISAVMTTLTIVASPWPILGFIGGILILSEARKKDSVMLRSEKRENL